MTLISNPESFRTVQAGLTPAPSTSRAAQPAAATAAVCRVAPPSGPRDLGDISFLGMSASSSMCHFDFVEGGEDKHTDLSQQLGQQIKGDVSTRLNQLAEGLPAEAATNLRHLAKLVNDPERFVESMSFLLKNPSLDPATRDQFVRLAGLINEITATASQSPPDKQALSALLTGTPAKGPDFPLSTALGYAEQSLVFDQHMQKHSAREAVPKILNQAFGGAMKVMRSGKFQSPIALRNAVMNQVETELALRNRSRLENASMGKYKSLIENLQTRFAHNMQNVPGFKEAVAEAATAAGIPFTSPDQLANPDILGQIPGELLTKAAQHLSARLQMLENNSATESASSRSQVEPLRQALRTLLKDDLPVISTMRSEFQQMRAHFLGYAEELKSDLTTAAADMGLELPEEYLSTYMADPLKARETLDTWLSEQRTAAAGDPTKLHKLENINLFAVHLEKLSLMTNRIDRSEPIEPALIESYERFQTFILAKRAVTQSYELASEQDKPRLREAVMNFGNRFAELSALEPAAMQKELFKWLGEQGVSTQALESLQSSLRDVRQSIDNLNSGGEVSRETGFSMNPNNKPPERQEGSSLLSRHDQIMNDNARADSSYLRGVFERLGDEGLSAALEADMRQVLEPMSRGLNQLIKAIEQMSRQPVNFKVPDEKSAQTAESESQTQAAANEAPLPDALAIEQRLTTAQAQQRLQKEVENIKQELIQSLRDQRNQANALSQARRLRDQLQHQIFEIHNSRNQEQNRHKLESLEAVAAQLRELGV